MLVSIVCPVFNSEVHLSEFLTSLDEQDYYGFEVVFVDDFSTDNSLRLLEQYNPKSFKKILLRNEKNLGPGPTRNFGLSRVSGKYVCFFDPDDVIDKSALSNIVKYAELEEYDFIRGNGEYFVSGEFSKRLPLPNVSLIDKSVTVKDDAVSVHGLPWYHVLFAFRTDKLRELKLEYPQLRVGEDPVFLFNALCQFGRGIFIPETLYYYRTSHHEVKHFNTIEKVKDFCFHMAEIKSIAIEFNKLETFYEYFSSTFWYVFDNYIFCNEECILKCFDILAPLISSFDDVKGSSNNEYQRLILLVLASNDIEGLKYLRALKIKSEGGLSRERRYISTPLTSFYTTSSWSFTRPFRRLLRLYFLFKDYFFLRFILRWCVSEYIRNNSDIKTYRFGPRVHYLLHGAYEAREWCSSTEFEEGETVIPDSVFTGFRPLFRRKS